MPTGKSDTGRTVSRRRLLQATGASGVALTAGCMGGDNGNGDTGDDDTGDDDTGTGDDSDSDDGEIVIGALQGFSGLFPPMAQNHQDGLEYAIEEINANGGVLGRDLVQVSVDTEGDPSTAITEFTRFVEDDNIVAATGPIASDIGLQVSQQAEDMEVPFVPHVAASHALLTRDSRYTFRLGSHPSPSYAQAAVDLLDQEGYTNAAVVYADFAWGHSYEEILGRDLPDHITLDEYTAPATETDFSSYLRQMDSDIEAMLGAGHPPGIVNLYSQMLELDITPEIYLGAANTPGMIWEAGGEDLLQSYLQYGIIDYTSDAYHETGEQYSADTGEMFDGDVAAGYITVHLIAEAIENADSTDPVDIADAIRNNTYDLMMNDTLEYTEWGEFAGMPFSYYEFVDEGPDFHPENDWWVEEVYRSDPMEPWDPDTEI